MRRIVPTLLLCLLSLGAAAGPSASPGGTVWTGAHAAQEEAEDAAAPLDEGAPARSHGRRLGAPPAALPAQPPALPGPAGRPQARRPPPSPAPRFRLPRYTVPRYGE